jgi:RNA polymerase sigma-70 factor (ECF subfamily)
MMDAHASVIQELFRREFARMVAVIGRRFGLDYLDVAEDVVSETFLQATETWGVKGIPPNPPAWLYAVANQKMLYHLRRTKIFREKVLPQLGARDGHETTGFNSIEMDFSGENIRDSQLRMLFAVSSPVIASEAQIALALRVLAGFRIDEIAEAFLTTADTIHKRLYRARQKLRSAGISLEMPSAGELTDRLSTVLRILYLMFNEGYYSTTHNLTLRKDFCLEAMRLATLLTAYQPTDLPGTHALLALMCFHASRFDARRSPAGENILYDDQDVTRWDGALIRQGMVHLDRSAGGSRLTAYHLEAGIAYWHTKREDTPEKWERILGYYDLLREMNPSPAVVLNRLYALYRARGADQALAEAPGLAYTGNAFYHLLMGELLGAGDVPAATEHLSRALALVRTEADARAIRKKISALQESP